MPKKELLKKFAKLSVEIGANVQKNQVVWVSSSTDNNELARLVVEAAYEAGAKSVLVNWFDDYVTKSGYVHQSIETLQEIPEWLIGKYQQFIDDGGCIINISSPVPGLNADVDSKKLQANSIARSKAFKFYQNHMMGNKAQWTIIAAPNPVWAKRVFPELEEADAIEKLWDAILQASRVTEDNDPVQEWNDHNKRLLSHNKVLNDHQFKELHFTNRLGTDLHVELVPHHIWAGGGENSTSGVYFNPNIPTEENFTMPNKFGVNGKVVATKPLNYQGKLVEDFWFEFNDGKVVNYDAKKELGALKNLIEYDEGSSYLGEVALISYDSPINNSGILFYNTLFDENASCHLALGRAYPMNVQGGTEMSEEELIQAGSNQSMAHVDFMFGSSDMNIVGIKQDGTKVQIFEKGDFVI
ncbi:aminopeptidase [Candidatus Xianfuyuplasma coldseepsis]|uniref:Aminopeptidase n=1 Tax=Candidatus Xianfuyuplasma coldseepsis TaxID=2782163 RepID=A0A7L7KQC3_9MOLU|nr:aminopeptidase [Xianfuyuplasma coldseepsis]QMS84629.1 aminopeptidase [Xianfuyuplasma coldseepsis]